MLSKEFVGLIDVFISHASEDKETIVDPLTKVLELNHITYWLDSEQILWGDSTTRKINEGLKNSKYLIVILSETFISKNWPLREFNSQISKEVQSGKEKILPLFACAPDTKQRIIEEFPLIHDKKYLNWNDGPEKVISELKRLLETKNSTPTRSHGIDIQRKPRDIPIPHLKQKITQYDKDRFIKETYQEIKDYFHEGLTQLQEYNPEIKTDFTEVSKTSFVCKIYIHGEIRCACRIWVSDSYSNAIGFEESSSISFSHGESFNELVTINDDDQKLSLKFTMGYIGMKNRDRSFLPQDTAEELWRRFTKELAR